MEEKNAKLVFKFNFNSKATWLDAVNSKAGKLQAELSLDQEVSMDDKVWLITRMNEQIFFSKGKCIIACMGWGLCFKPFMTRFIYRFVGESRFNILYAFDEASAKGYLEYLSDKLYEETDEGIQSVAELYELPEN